MISVLAHLYSSSLIFALPPLFSLSVSLFSYSLNSFWRVVFCIFFYFFCIIFFTFGPCAKIFACLRTFQPTFVPRPASLIIPSFSHLVSQLVNKRDDRSEACVRAFGVGVVVSAYGIWDSGNPESKSKSQTPQFSFSFSFLRSNFVMRLQIFNNCPDL